MSFFVEVGKIAIDVAKEAIEETAKEAGKEVGKEMGEVAKEVIGKGKSIFPSFFKNDMPSLSSLENKSTSKLENTSEVKKNKEIKVKTYNDSETMDKELGKTEIKENKPPHSPNIDKWFENGGSIKIEEIDGKQTWTYIDKEGREVTYKDGYPEFPPEAKHPEISDIDIGEFTGDREKDKELYLKELEEQYGLTEIPEGYTLHHDAKNGTLQLVKTDWHKEFTHVGGHSLFKEG